MRCMKVTLSSHGAYHLQYHIVWVAKYRRRILKPAVEETLCTLIPHLLRSKPGCRLETIGFDKDHLHMVMTIPPKYAIADVMGELKSQSASYLRKKYVWLEKVYWKENIVWSPGYFVGSVGLDEAMIKRYVVNQGKQDLGQAELEL
jgi:putative transposase